MPRTARSIPTTPRHSAPRARTAHPVACGFALFTALLTLTALTTRAEDRVDLLKKVGIDQHLGAQVPTDLVFRDENGTPVKLGDYFSAGGRPIVLTLVYYNCPMLCTTVLNELNVSMNTQPENFSAGREFDVITVSFDPHDTPDLAAAKKQTYLRQYGRPGAEAGWHFLTGDQASIDALTKAVGFRYVVDPQPYTPPSGGGQTGFTAPTQDKSAAGGTQYIHAGGIMILTPTGKVSRYFFGINYAPKDLRLALTEAGAERQGVRVTDAILLFCFHYDPYTGKYTVAVLNLLKVFAGLLLAVIAFFWTRSMWRERRAARAAPLSPSIPTGLG